MKKIFLFSLALLAATVIAAPAFSGSASAQQQLIDAAQCEAGENARCIDKPAKDPAVGQNCSNNNCNIFKRYLNPLIRTMAALVGVAVTVGIVVGGIQYITSGGDPQKAASGKQHIKMAVVALIGFILMYATLQFLFPGDVVGR